MSDAVVAAVRERFGPGASVIVDAVSGMRDGVRAPFLVRFAPNAKIGPRTALLVASASARAGDPQGSPLRSWTTAQRTGASRAYTQVTAALRVAIDHLHTRTAVRRGAELDASDLLAAHHVVGSMPLRAWPTRVEAGGGRAARDLEAGECLRPGAVIPRLAVRTGDHVIAIARVDGIEARSTLVATTGGRPGTVIRVTNPGTRRALRARVVEPGVVEMVQD